MLSQTRISSAIGLALLMSAAPVSAGEEDGYVYRCAHETGQQQIDACTYLIDGKRKQIDADWAVSYINRGVAYQARGDFKKAIFDYTQAITLAPQSGVAYVDMGSVFDANGQHDQAIDLYNLALEAQPDFVLAYFARAKANAEANRHDRAIPDYDAYLKAVPNDPELFNNRGVSYEAPRAIRRRWRISIRPSHSNPTMWRRGRIEV